MKRSFHLIKNFLWLYIFYVSILLWQSNNRKSSKHLRLSHRQQISQPWWIEGEGCKLSISRRKFFCWKSIFYFLSMSQRTKKLFSTNNMNIFPRLFGSRCCSRNIFFLPCLSSFSVMKIYDHSFRFCLCSRACHHHSSLQDIFIHTFSLVL